MSRYIDADELLNALQGQVSEVCNKIPYDKEVFTILHDRQMEIYNLIEKQPTADVVEVAHASWELVEEDFERIYICAACKNYEAWGDWERTPYCPLCGAKLTKDRWGIYEHEANDCILAYYEVYDEDLDKWNTRKPMDRIVEKLESEISSNKKLIPPRGGKAFYEGTIRGLRKALKIVKEGGK